MFSKKCFVCFAVTMCIIIESAHAQDEGGGGGGAQDERLSIVQGGSTVFLETGKKRALFCKGTELGKQWLNVRGEAVGGRSPTARAHTELTGAGSQLVLIIDYADQSDNGTWTCSAGDLSRTLDIYIIEEVKFKTKEGTVTAKEGDERVALPCVAHGTPQPSLAWYRDSQDIAESGEHGKYRLINVTRSDTRSLKLEIRNVNRSDAGEYECKAIQQVQKEYLHYETTTTLVQVNHPPTLVQPLVHQSVTEAYAIIGERKELVCAAQAFPPPTYKWTRVNDRNWEYRITDNVETAENGSSSKLTVDVQSETDLGNYMCEAINEHGTAKTTIHVSQGNKPQPLAEVVFRSATNESLTFEVTCVNCTLPISGADNSEDPSNLPVTKYRFEALNETAGADWETNRDFIIFAELPRFENQTEYTLPGLQPLTAYRVRVAAINMAGLSDYTEAGVLSTVSAAQAAAPASALLALALLVLGRR